MFGIFKAMKELRQEQEYFRNECSKVERDFENKNEILKGSNNGKI